MEDQRSELNKIIGNKTIWNMYRKQPINKTTIEINESLEGETIEQKVERIVNNKEPIKDGADAIYTERKDGVQPGYNIRTDRFEIAVDAMDAVTKAGIAKRAGKAEMTVVKGETEGQSTDGQSNPAAAGQPAD